MTNYKVHADTGTESRATAIAHAGTALDLARLLCRCPPPKTSGPPNPSLLIGLGVCPARSHQVYSVLAPQSTACHTKTPQVPPAIPAPTQAPYWVCSLAACEGAEQSPRHQRRIASLVAGPHCRGIGSSSCTLRLIGCTSRSQQQPHTIKYPHEDSS